MFRNILLFLVVLVFSYKTFAQDQYVEVVVKDTVLAEPQKWTVFVQIQESYDYTTITGVTGDSVSINSIPQPEKNGINTDQKKQTSINDLKSLVKKFNGRLIEESTYVNYSSPLYRAGSNTERNYLNAEFSTRSSLEGFMKAIAALHEVSANIVSTYSSQMEDIRNRLDDKLIKAARTQAAKLAQLGGRKLGNILLITEATAAESNPFQVLFDLIKFDSMDRMRNAFNNSYSDKIKLEKTLKVRFAW